MKKGLVIFDCFGTLLDIDSFAPYKHFLEEVGLDIRDHYARIMKEKDIDWWSFVDKKKVTLSTYKNAEIEFKRQLEKDMQSVKPFLIDLEERLLKLKEDYVVCLLSNLGQGYEVEIEKHIAPYIDKCFYSFEIGLIKPDVESYKLVMNWATQNFGTIADEHVYLIDDKEKNIRSAREMGINALLVNNAHINSSYSIKAVFEFFDKKVV